MTAKRTAIPRYRPFQGPILFAQGFRPFFFAAGLWAAVAVAAWLPMLQGRVTIPTAFGSVGWHAHEMIFGFVAAAAAGFLLTAIPNWTGRMPLQGAPLGLLFAVWLLGRLAVGLSAIVGPGVAAFVDLSFVATLLAVVLREIVSGRNWRNLPVPVLLVLLLLANGLIHLEAVNGAATAALGQRLAVAVIVFLISLIGGRVIPSFTRNWLAKRGAGAMPASFGAFDRLCLAALALALAAWVVSPTAGGTGVLLLAAGVATLARVLRWRGHRTLGEPLVWSLHLGFLWLPLGLLLVGASALTDGVPPTAGLHALTAGAMGGMTLAVMTRATLGHTGRSLSADRWSAALYLLAAAAAACRVAAPFLTAAYLPMLTIAGLLWVAAFGLFSLRYGRLLAAA